jgi:hypothetical protein
MVLPLALAGWMPIASEVEAVTFSEHFVSTSAPQPSGVVAADVDGDGDTDVVTAEYSLNGVAWYENDGASPPAWTKHIVDPSAAGPITVAVGDVDRDGDVDIFSANFNDEGIAVYENSGPPSSSWTKRVISNFWGDPWAVDAADVDGDGDIDGIGGLTNSICGPPLVCVGVEWYENDGATPPAFIIRAVSAGLVGASSVRAADVDGDGDADILSVDTANDRVLWFENDGAHPPAWKERVITTTVDDPWSVFSADLDRDGDTDILSASAEDDRVTWHENDGASPPSWTTRTIAAGRDGAISVFAADLDADGDPDVIAGSWWDSTLAWYESDGGAPPAFTEHMIATCGGPEGIFAARIDGDADIDVLCAANPANKVHLFENEENFSDADGDGVRDELDCAPGNAAAFAVPREVQDLRFLSPTELAWGTAAPSSGSGAAYDLVGGSLAGLPVGSSPGEACLGAGLPGTRSSAVAAPPSRAGFFYLVRAANGCGVGAYGADSAGAARVSVACP